MAVSKLQALVEGSELSQSDKDMWLRTLEIMDDEQAQAVIEAVGSDAHDLEEMTRNIKLKQVAFANGDLGLLDQMLEEESADIAQS